MKTATRHRDKDRTLVESRLAYHLRCLREDATDPTMSAVERLALVRDRARRIREIRQDLETAKPLDADGVA
jgi:hypothetical protein